MGRAGLPRRAGLPQKAGLPHRPGREVVAFSMLLAAGGVGSPRGSLWDLCFHQRGEGHQRWPVAGDGEEALEVRGGSEGRELV